MKNIQNPILKGFNPDPSIIRVGEDYYIATSTFEWFPGVQIHHSKDLVNWQVIAQPLNRVSQLDMRGNPDSCGVWAPCLSYDNGIFYLIYSNVRSFDGVWKDTPNYLVTTNDITGEWSEPIYLDSRGFDPSLFHDDDGRKWYTSMIVDYRKGKFFGGIILQEFDTEQRKLVGEVYHIFEGTALGCTEGPHIYKKDGYYYLLTAEGGTEYNHAISLARSKTINGKYELHPSNPIICTKDYPKNPLQKSGHGDLVQTQDGDWYAVFLVGRPLTERGRCITGRETAIEKMVWKEDGWLYPESGHTYPRTEVPAPNLESFHFEQSPSKDDFDNEKLSLDFQSLRIPATEEWLTLKERKGYLRLYGQESLSSFHNQSLIARRVQEQHVQASTCLEFEPENFQHLAGLICYYNTSHYFYLYVSQYENKKILNIISCDKYQTKEPLAEPINITGNKKIYMKVDFNGNELQFYYAFYEGEWQAIGDKLDGSILSDDYIQFDLSGRYCPAFTGAFVGVCCQDLTGHKKYADFDWFEYKELKKD